ncbi:MAG: Xylose isomerase protein barrel [Paenibacillus sp.]|nr:Xylose isomerase protein barrel [Paenibacillus sp.]
MGFKIAFQTLACPDWEWTRILDEAVRLGYDGVELRGVKGEMYLPKAAPFLPEQIDHTIEDLKRRNLHICCLDTSCSFHNPDNFAASIQEGKDTIDLAVKLGTRYIRVFGDKLPAEIGEAQTVASISSGLSKLGEYASGKGVTVLLETHGDINNYKIIQAVFQELDSDSVGVLWDFEHPFMSGEEPEVTFRELGAYIQHVHVKDARKSSDGQKLCMVGDGDVPVERMISILQQNGYEGWLTLEYEKKWAPYLEEPEVSLPAFISYIRGVLEGGASHADTNHRF